MFSNVGNFFLNFGKKTPKQEKTKFIEDQLEALKHKDKLGITGKSVVGFRCDGCGKHLESDEHRYYCDICVEEQTSYDLCELCSKTHQTSHPLIKCPPTVPLTTYTNLVSTIEFVLF